MIGAVRAAGERALLVDAAAPALVGAAIRTIDGVEDVLPAARTVLVTLTADADRAAVVHSLKSVVAAEPESADGTVLTIPTRYDGADLEDVADLLSMSVDDVIAAHSAILWECAFVGFAPGFGYLIPIGDGPDLTVPRRDEPRVAIDPGSVALAGGYCAVYPRRSPGGWRLIGRTDLTLWDLARDDPALIQPGTRVRFESVRSIG